jgi:hypothetical protein
MPCLRLNVDLTLVLIRTFAETCLTFRKKLVDTNLTTPKSTSPTTKAKRAGIYPAIWNCLFHGQEGSDQIKWHVLLAQSMVIFALAAAISAGAAAVVEQEAQRLERLLTWGHHLAFIHREELLADATIRAALEVLATSHVKQGKEYLTAAEQMPSEQHQLEKHAQEEIAAARSLRPFLAALPNPFLDNLRTESAKKYCFLYGGARL